MHFTEIRLKHWIIGFMLIFGFNFWSCKDPQTVSSIPELPVVLPDSSQRLTIFFINDQHGQLDNFAKIKRIVDGTKDSLNVLLVCAGDMFSGNPIVDQYAEKGYPMIDIMNQTGFDVSVIGNHEFDYGQEVLTQRMNQAEFQWVCANVDVGETGIPQPDPYITIDVDGMKITFLGLVETDGKPNEIIPATHPWKVLGLEFQRFGNIVNNYANLKATENADLLVALTHLGAYSDRVLARDFSFFDVIIGGHSHEVVEEEVNGTPIVQAGSYLNRLGRIELKVLNKKVVDYNVDFIRLNDYPFEDEQLAEQIAIYNKSPEFQEVVGYSKSWMGKNEVGCFYTTALMEYLETDCAFQNGGGIRSAIDQGDITALEIYNMDPFNNQSVIFTMTVREIKQFFEETGAGEHVSGIILEQSQNKLLVYDAAGKEMSDNETITIGINDYIPAVYDQYFPLEKAEIKDFTTAEAIIGYLKTINSTVDYEGCDQYFDYQ